MSSEKKREQDAVTAAIQKQLDDLASVGKKLNTILKIVKTLSYAERVVVRDILIDSLEDHE